MTWLRLFWIFGLPLLSFLPALLPTLLGRPLGGIYRQAIVQWVVDLAPATIGLKIAEIFSAATVAGELVIVLLIVLHITAIAAWPLWIIGTLIIGVVNWADKTHYTQLRKHLR